ncbi:MAG: hypothetical protein A4S09_09330 [Proteobacteria bacterium SG_bin7]|nr:MAG: hypothetical protein A4S09_09330 [Proteobacteria bacterium SG_bin7]
MRVLVIALGFLFPLSLFATQDRMEIDISANGLFQIAYNRVYEKGGPREGMFFSDLMASAPALKKKKIDDFYGPAKEPIWAFEIDQYYMSEAVQAAETANDHQAVKELNELKPLFGHIGGDEYKERFKEILRRQFDRRVGLMVKDLENRLQRQNGNFAAMLEEYRLVVEKLEGRAFLIGVQKFFIYVTLGAGMFATSFLGVPVLLAL